MRLVTSLQDIVVVAMPLHNSGCMALEVVTPINLTVWPQRLSGKPYLFLGWCIEMKLVFERYLNDISLIAGEAEWPLLHITSSPLRLNPPPLPSPTASCQLCTNGWEYPKLPLIKGHYYTQDRTAVPGFSNIISIKTLYEADMYCLRSRVYHTAQSQYC